MLFSVRLWKLIFPVVVSMRILFLEVELEIRGYDWCFYSIYFVLSDLYDRFSQMYALVFCWFLVCYLDYFHSCVVIATCAFSFSSLRSNWNVKIDY